MTLRLNKQRVYVILDKLSSLPLSQFLNVVGSDLGQTVQSTNVITLMIVIWLSQSTNNLISLFPDYNNVL
jgi:hypothetical protein